MAYTKVRSTWTDNAGQQANAAAFNQIETGIFNAAATADQALSAALGPVGINQQSGTAYTPVATDAGKVIEATNAAVVTITIPADIFTGSTTSSQYIEIYAAGAGGVNIVAGTGMTMRPSSPQVAAQYTSRRVRFRSATECVVE